MEPATPTSLPGINFDFFLSVLGENATSSLSFDSVQAWADNIWHITSSMAFILTLMSIAILLYSTMRLRQIRHEEHHIYGTIEEDVHEKQVDHARFAHIMTLIESAHESDWRQAIIEADIMLDDLLKQLKIQGDTLGDRLKNADKSTFKTLDNAWTAHKVRNEIAHKGSAYKLSNHLAYRTIKQYESVFREHGEI
jgi:hypothetical protein